ncbi:MAG TPA: riboflavin biosynthesis protein RibF [Opitutae bacterium]|nr:riboflavin biosynthesis protein RibF [Opitutae bacterium]|tara:strand:+ start:355 stop:1326 length:972 start_codon:yes stop_codon:yes gene_type:complete
MNDYPNIVVDSFDKVKLPEGPLHLALGMFDGVHLGHQAVIEAAVHSARREGGVAAVLTFWPHPSVILQPNSPKMMIIPLDLKERLLKDYGIDHVIVRRFDRDLASITAETFIPLLKKSFPTLKTLYVGDNFRFGKGRVGDVSYLLEQSQEYRFSVISVPRLKYNGERISSTRIRNILEEGDVRLANALLGYTYFVAGTVVEGAKRGRTIGFPTINIPWDAQLQLRYGVYSVFLKVEKGTQLLPGVANFGLRPTVGDVEHPLLEVHLFEKPENIEPKAKVQVQFFQFIRPEEKFASLNELKTQIGFDKERATKFFKTQKIACVV